MKVTSTWLLTSAAQVIITIFLGSFMIVTAIVVGSHFTTAYKNYQKYQALDVAYEGRIHRFLDPEFTNNPNGVIRNCVAITANGRIAFHEFGTWDGKPPPAGNFCKDVFTKQNLDTWEYRAPTKGSSSFMEKVGWSILFLVVFMGAALLITSIPANLIGVAIPALAPYARIMTFVFALPMLLFWAMFVREGFSFKPTYWKYQDRYQIKTEKVYITKDYRMFAAPERLFDWADQTMLEERTIKFE